MNGFAAENTDTTPDAARVHAQLLRTAGPEKRLNLALSISSSSMELARAGIRQRHRGFSEKDVDLELVSICYGERTSERLRDALRETS